MGGSKVRKRGHPTIFPSHPDWPERATLLLTFYRGLFQRFVGIALVLSVCAVLAFFGGIALAMWGQHSGYTVKEWSVFWGDVILFGVIVAWLTVYIQFKRPVVEGWAKGYWYLWFESWGSDNAILWDSLTKGITCQTFLLNEPVLTEAFQQISPYFHTFDGESKFIEHSGELFAHLSETTFSRQRIPMADVDWTKLDIRQPLMQALVSCPPLSRGEARMIESLALPSPILSRIDTASLISRLNTFVQYSDHTWLLLNSLRDGVCQTLERALKSLQECVPDVSIAPPMDPSRLLGLRLSSMESLANSTDEAWKLVIQAIEEEIRPDLERVKDRTSVHISQVQHERTIALSQLATQFQILLESADRELNDLKRQRADEECQRQTLHKQMEVMRAEIKRFARIKSQEQRRAQEYSRAIARLSWQEQNPTDFKQFEIEQRRLNCLQKAGQAEIQYHQYNVELRQLTEKCESAVRKINRLIRDIRAIKMKRQSIEDDWQAADRKWNAQFEQQIHDLMETERKEKHRLRREVRALNAVRTEILAAIRGAEEGVDVDGNKLPQTLANLYEEVENRLIECRRNALRVALDDCLRAIGHCKTHLTQTCSVMERTRRPVRPLQVNTSYGLPVWVIVYRKDVLSPVSFHYTTLAQVKQKRNVILVRFSRRGQ